MNQNLPRIEASQKSLLTTPYVLSPHLKLLLDTIKSACGKGILVGGVVRDHLLGLKAKDIDIEVYGIDVESLEALLKKHFSVYAVGKAFGIFKVVVSIKDEKASFDVALPRRENKEGHGHKGFVIMTDAFMSFADAASRRDFTINAMGIDTESNELLDPYDGKGDLLSHRLKHVSDAFKEDPLRVLRAAQFCARFSLRLDETTKILCQSLRNELFTLSKERIFEEMKKLLLAKKPSLGLKIIRETKAIELFPELEALIDCPQDKEWHPEGDVWTHTLMVVDEAVKLVEGLAEEEKLLVITGALCHDFGKPLTTIEKDGRIKSPAHEQAGILPTETFLETLGFPKKLIPDVVSLVKDHLKPYQLYNKRDEINDSAIRRLAARVNIDRLILVSEADFLGRTTKEALAGHDPSKSWLLDKFNQILGTERTIKPLLLGRHLLALGEKPGSHFTYILHEAFQAQMDGEFLDEDEAVVWLKSYLKKFTSPCE